MIIFTHCLFSSEEGLIQDAGPGEQHHMSWRQGKKHMNFQCHLFCAQSSFYWQSLILASSQSFGISWPALCLDGNGKQGSQVTSEKWGSNVCQVHSQWTVMSSRPVFMFGSYRMDAEVSTQSKFGLSRWQLLNLILRVDSGNEGVFTVWMLIVCFHSYSCDSSAVKWADSLSWPTVISWAITRCERAAMQCFFPGSHAWAPRMFWTPDEKFIELRKSHEWFPGLASHRHWLSLNEMHILAINMLYCGYNCFASSPYYDSLEDGRWQEGVLWPCTRSPWSQVF